MENARIVGRYALYEALGAGGAAAVHLGVDRTGGDAVAIKRLHDREVGRAAAITRLVDEVRVAKRIAHPNVVRVVELVSDGEEMLAVMEYIHGEALSKLLREGPRVSPSIACAVLVDVLRGLHAAHEATDDARKPLALVHRDVTPENVLVGADGRARITDFGVAKAEGRLNVTRDGGIKGKIAYLAPEQVGGEVSPRTDVYAAGLVLWEVLVGERPIQGETEAEMVGKVIAPSIAPPTTRGAASTPELDAVVMRALSVEASARWPDAAAFADAIAAAHPLATSAEIGAWVRSVAGERLARRERILASARPPPPRSRSRVAGIGLVAAVAAVIVLGWYAASTRAAARESTATATATATATTTTTTTATAPTTTTAIASASAGDVTTPTQPAARATGAHVKHGGKGGKCDPPWILDSNGIRRYDPACM